MRCWLVLVFLLGFCWLLVGCADRNRKIEEGKVRFQTTDASRLYFHNVRSIRYRIETIGKDRMQICRHKDFTEAALALYPVIANNYMHDQAYIFHEMADSLRQKEAVLLVGEPATDTLSLNLNTHEAHYRFAQELYNAIVADQKLQLCLNGECHDFLTNEELRKTFRLVYRDYFRLVQVFK